MKKERFAFVCQEAEAGNDAFVKHESSLEEGLVRSCSKDQVVVHTAEGKDRRWAYSECEELSRSKEEWPWR
ncbi:hypothetical protein DSOUD_1457 [Desulfuromonas soudanensis]|uniref:Uncharacterized protein n=1 Tax=Desulfuromonas soudanensis TaxID=1603606 RepID=A0A0M5IKV7_9BACT|nr:hypothetical protein [Desulfuromonas soudanensis]ALC16236.1 hypothetical protein DSOUD_1457 [Desulfuromonas soudanensis]